MAEWLKAHAWKACLGETLTWVRIPLSPPYNLICREVRLDCCHECRQAAEFRDSCSETGLEKVSSSRPQPGVCGHSLRKPPSAVRFQRLPPADGMRSQYDDEVKADLSLSEIPVPNDDDRGPAGLIRLTLANWLFKSRSRCGESQAIGDNELLRRNPTSFMTDPLSQRTTFRRPRDHRRAFEARKRARPKSRPLVQFTG